MSLLGELSEQPTILERILTANFDRVAEIAGSLDVGDVDYVLIAARGTSDNAARYAQYVWGARNQLPVALAAPSLFGAYDKPPKLARALVVGISQSGESPDLIAVLDEANRQGRPTLALTNDPGSRMAASADVLLELAAGEERAVAATKTYTAQLLAVAMLSEALRGHQEPDDLAGLPAAAGFMLEQSDHVAALADVFRDTEYCAVLGRGYNHATAFEWALKLQELTYVLAQPYSTADFLHGPVALVEPGFPVLAVAPAGPPHADVLTLLQQLQADRQARLLVVSDDQATLDVSEFAIPLPQGIPEWLTAIPAIIGAQLFTYHLTIAKGLDPDQPRGLSKVTRTR